MAALKSTIEALNAAIAAASRGATVLLLLEELLAAPFPAASVTVGSAACAGAPTNPKVKAVNRTRTCFAFVAFICYLSLSQ
jgi:hypothetical protein